MFPPARRETARKLAAEVTQVFGSYISGQVIVSAITGAVIAIASAVIGFKFSLIIGIVAGVAYAIPIIGMLIAEIVAVPLCVPQGLFMVVAVQVIMFGMARISDNVLGAQDHGRIRRRLPDRRHVRRLRRRRVVRHPRFDSRHPGRRAHQNRVALFRRALAALPIRNASASSNTRARRSEEKATRMSDVRCLCHPERSERSERSRRTASQT